MVPTTFGGAVSAVPHLANSCCSALATASIPGSGLKLMRLVSRQLRVAMLGVVQGYTLIVDGKASGLLDEMTLLESTRLTKLRVIVLEGNDGVVFRSQTQWSAHKLQFHFFMEGMMAAIGSITRLSISIPPCAIGNTQGVDPSFLLFRLAAACPALQHLQVEGVTRDLISAFGTSCSSLYSLQVMGGIPSESLLHLHLILPSLTHCLVEAPLFAPMATSVVARPCTLAVLSCASLTDLDIGCSSLTRAMWQALPLGLRRLQCAINGDVPSLSNPLTSLTSFTCHCPCHAGVSLRNMVQLLRMAPMLQHIILSCQAEEAGDFSMWLVGRCLPSTFTNLVYLNERALAGLIVNLLPFNGPQIQGINVRLWASDATHEDGEPQDGSIEDFFAQLPPLKGITGLRVSNEDTNGDDRVLAGMIADLFPNVDVLDLELEGVISSIHLTHLGRCVVLRHLTLRGAIVCPSSLSILCTKLTALKDLCLIDCGLFTAEDGVLMEEQLRVWGMDVSVSVA